MRYCKTHSRDTAVRLFRRSADLPKEWDQLLPDNHFLKTMNLSVSEEAAFPDLTHMYAFITSNNKPVAVCYFQLLQLNERHLDTNQLKPIQSFAWKGFTKMFTPKLLIAGHLFRHDICSFYSDKTFSAFDTYNFYQAAITNALSQTRALAVLVKDLPTELSTYFRNYAPEFQLLRNDISMQIELAESWNSLQDYYSALKHKYKQRFRKIRGSWNRVDIKELSVSETWEKKQIIYDLYKKVSDHQQVRIGLLSENYIPLLKQKHPELLKIWLVSESGKPVAFFSAWVQSNAFDMFYIGMDYSRNEELLLYFNTLFFALERAILLKKKKLILGRTALEPKARLGCKPKYLSTFLYIRNYFLRAIILRLQQRIFISEGEWENRHPFK